MQKSLRITSTHSGLDGAGNLPLMSREVRYPQLRPLLLIPSLTDPVHLSPDSSLCSLWTKNAVCHISEKGCGGH